MVYDVADPLPIDAVNVLFESCTQPAVSTVKSAES